MPTSAKPNPAPDPFTDTFVEMAAARAVMAAARLGEFAALAEHPARPNELAGRLGLHEAGTEALLAALASIGYLEAEADGTHRLAEVAARLLVSGSPDSIATLVGEYGSFE